MQQQIQDALSLVRSALRAGRGDVELVDISADGIVKVKPELPAVDYGLDNGF